MSDEELQKMLSDYVDIQMDSIVPEEMEGYSHEFSKKHKKKMQRLFFYEKHFGKKMQVAYTLRKIAMIVIILSGIFCIGEVSARVFIFGEKPWKYTEKNTDIMEKRVYKKENKEELKGELQKVKREIPAYLPEGFVINTHYKDELGSYMDWKRNGVIELQYDNAVLEEEPTIIFDNEYKTKEPVSVCGYQGYIYTKDEECWIIWDDLEYNHYIFCINMENASEELLKMAESFY